MGEEEIGVGHLMTVTNCHEIKIFKNGVIEILMNEPIEGSTRINILKYLDIDGNRKNIISFSSENEISE